jgi:cytidine deaminase
MERAYAPYSQFRVGAALVGADGAIFTGCNVENSAYPAGICAERSALAAAVAGGVKEFAMLVIASEADDPTPPCGMCRQALVEFAPRLLVVSYTKHGVEATWDLATVASTSVHPGRADSSPMKLGRIVGYRRFDAKGSLARLAQVADRPKTSRPISVAKAGTSSLSIV